MKREFSWIIWVLLIVLVILIFPKPCGNKKLYASFLTENEKVSQIPENINEEKIESINGNMEEDLDNDEDFKENISDDILDNFNEDFEAGLTGEAVLNAEKTNYKCLGIKDSILGKLNKNSSIQFCYGMCIIEKSEKERNNETDFGDNGTKDSDERIPSFLRESIKSFLGVIGLIIVVIFLILIINFFKSFFKQTRKF